MEVVVTARRRTENLQDVPLTVTAHHAPIHPDAADVTNVEDLNSFVPNLKISQDRATSSTINIYIRGVGQSDPLWGFEPGVGVYVDDVYMARPQAALLDVLDVDRLEVLSGPQGTLYGKNTIAGALKYVTRDIAGPGHADRLRHRRQLRRARLPASAARLPSSRITSTSALALGNLNHDGYGNGSHSPGSPQPVGGHACPTRTFWSARANLTVIWGESSKLRLIADDILDNSNASGRTAAQQLPGAAARQSLRHVQRHAGRP